MAYSFWKRFAVLFVIYGVFGWILELYFQYLYLLANGHFFWVYPSSPESPTIPIVFFLWGASCLCAVIEFKWLRKQSEYIAAKPFQQFAALAAVLGITATIAEFIIARTVRFFTGENLWEYIDSPITETTPFMPPLWGIMGIIFIGIYVEAQNKVFPRLGV